MRVRALTAAGLLIAGIANAADNFPAKPVRMIVPAPPGGVTDALARLLAHALAQALGQQVIVDNRGGGGTLIATQLVARATGDGHTIFYCNSAFTTNPALVKDLPYDTLNDFAPLSQYVDSPLVLVAHPSLNVGTLKELLAAAKARPGAINYATSTPGTGGHLAVELLKVTTGIDITQISYKGAAPAMNDLLAGQVQLMFTSPLSTLPHVRSGRLRALAMSGLERLRVAPDIPTIDELGYKGFRATLWYGLLAPAATPAAITSRLTAEISRFTRAPATVEQLTAQGVTPIGSSAEEFGAFIRADIEKWRRVVREAGISVR